MAPRTPLTPPKHLEATGRALFRKLQAEYGITDAGGVLLLTQIGECADRMALARSAIAKHGEVTLDRYGQPRLNPALALEKDARGQLMQAIKLLGLELEPEQLARRTR